jgi:uncharacterized protein YprB with RNaseH-like and TPR domain
MSPNPRAGSSVRPIDAVVPGRVVENEHGVFYSVQVDTPNERTRGGIRFGDVLEARGDLIAIAGRDAELADIDVNRTAFVDTETTGLAGGTGTYAFLVGIGFFRDGNFVVRQYFMRDQSEEKAMMAAVSGALRQFDWGVTFNGRSFDFPLLATRFILSRIRPQLDHMVHLDLLHTCRRIWGRAPFAAGGGLRLGSLESALLAHRRPTDVPSWQVPEIYFHYLRSGDAEDLRAVFAHNVEDILSMVSLLGVIDAVMGSWQTPGIVDPHAVVGIGRIFEMDGRLDRAAEAYAAALAESLQPEIAGKAAMSLSLIHKRLEDWSRAASIWEKLAEGKGRSAAAACVELAKYFEHRLSDFGRAYFYCMSAADRAGELEFPVGGQLSEWELEHRASRLRRRMTLAGVSRNRIRARPGAELSVRTVKR